MYPFGRRQPRDGRPGMYLSFWARTEEVALVDDLADTWGTNRSQAIKRAVAEAHAVESRKGMKAKLRRKRA